MATTMPANIGRLLGATLTVLALTTALSPAHAEPPAEPAVAAGPGTNEHCQTIGKPTDPAIASLLGLLGIQISDDKH
jgi:hypothetical protein